VPRELSRLCLKYHSRARTEVAIPKRHTMPQRNTGKQSERENNLQLAMWAYRKGKASSMGAMAERYGVPYCTLHDWLNGAQDRKSCREPIPLFTKQEEKAIVRWCNHLDDWCFPPKLTLVKQMAEHLIQKRAGQQTLGKHWLKRFLDRNSELGSSFSSRLDRQRAWASNPAVLRDDFTKVGLLVFFFSFIKC